MLSEHYQHAGSIVKQVLNLETGNVIMSFDIYKHYHYNAELKTEEDVSMAFVHNTCGIRFEGFV